MTLVTYPAKENAKVPSAQYRRGAIDLISAPRTQKMLRTPGDRWHRSHNRARLAKEGPDLRLHIGCGLTLLHGWVNIDRGRSSAADARMDLRGGLPLGKQTLRYAYSEHVIEHMRREQSLLWLQDLREGLRADGVVRVATPDLGYLVTRYHTKWRAQAWLEGPDYQEVRSAAQMLNLAMRAWGHQFIYDEDDLHLLLTEAGFGTVQRVKWGESNHDDLIGLERRADSTLVMEAMA